MTRQPLRFGVNLNNREPLIAPDYTLSDLLSLAERAEALGFDSVWVGDSLFSKPRWEPITLLSAISQRTSRVKLGTACMVSGTRHPLYLALEWATLDQLSGGRTILGTGMGNPEEGVRREYAAVGLDFEQAGQDLRGRSGRSARAVDDGRDELPGRALRLRQRLVLLRHRDGSARSGADAATDLGGQQSPFDRRHQAGGQDGARRQPCCAPHRPVRRWLDDLLPRPSPGRVPGSAGADRAGDRRSRSLP